MEQCKPMDIDHLKAFLAVADCQSFSLAANKLYLTQPAISKRIAGLEEKLGSPLFDRVGKQIQLTQAGAALLPRATVILNLMNEARQAMADLAGEVSGELQVATSHHLGLHKLPPVLRVFSKLYPNVNLKFEFLDSEVAIEKVLKGSCELAIVTLPPNPIEHIELESLWPDPLVFVSHNDASYRHINTLKQLSEMPAILPDLTTYTGRLVKNCFDQHGLALNINMSTNYLETIKMMVSVGLGWSVLPESMLDQQVCKIPVKQITLERLLGTAKHEKRHLSNAATALIDVLRANHSEPFPIPSS